MLAYNLCLLFVWYNMAAANNKRPLVYRRRQRVGDAHLRAGSNGGNIVFFTVMITASCRRDRQTK